MNAEEIELFKKGAEFAKKEFYLDSISFFKQLIEKFPNSDFCDDALYDIGLCYFHMGQFDKAIEQYRLVIKNFPNSKINNFNENIEFGKTSAKCHYSIINCFLALDKSDMANKELRHLDSFNNSYLMYGSKKITFKELAEKLIENYNKLKQ